jgi:hypothetical protein
VVTDQRTAVDRAHQIRNLVDVGYPRAECITLVMDNLNTRTGASLYIAAWQEKRNAIAQPME